MRNLRTSLVYLCLLFAASGFAQKMSYGLGVGAHKGVFTFENAEQLAAAGFTARSNTSPAASLILEYEATGTFSMRLQPVFTMKQIRFTEEIDGVERRNLNNLDLRYIALDLGITGRFALPLKKWQLTPFGGLNLSFNKHSNSVFKSRNSSGSSFAGLIVAQISQGNSFSSAKLFFKPGLVAGFGIGKLNGKLELEAKVVYTPIDFIKSDISIPFSESANLPFIGRFQYFGFGLNYKFITN